MKTRYFSILAAFLLVSLIAPVFAAEVLAPETVAVPKMADKDQPLMDITVMPGGQVIGKPGALFTQGGHYENMELPYLLSNPEPIIYPRWAVRQGWEGQINIAIEIMPNGSVGRTKIMQSTGYRMLDDAAHKAVKSWHFHPATENGVAVVTCIQIPILFELNRE